MRIEVHFNVNEFYALTVFRFKNIKKKKTKQKF